MRRRFMKATFFHFSREEKSFFAFSRVGSLVAFSYRSVLYWLFPWHFPGGDVMRMWT